MLFTYYIHMGHNWWDILSSHAIKKNKIYLQNENTLLRIE